MLVSFRVSSWFLLGFYFVEFSFVWIFSTGFGHIFWASLVLYFFEDLIGLIWVSTFKAPF